MPARDTILKEIQGHRQGAQDTVRRRYLAELAGLTGRNTIVYASGFTSRNVPNVPGFVFSLSLEDIQGFMGAIHGLKGDSLDLILHSPGGSFEAADQIVAYLRSKFVHLRAIVPQNAMSAATMVACACDEIVMGKQSAIGPIDPQVTLPSKHGHFTTPADAILRDFSKAKAEIIADPKSAALWVKLLEALPHGVLNQCENVIELSKQRVESWLRDYMRLDPAAAKEAAAWLGDANHHKTHGRPISLQLARQHGLKVTELEQDQALQDAVLSVFHATMVTFESTPCVKIIENHLGKGSYVILAQK